MDYSDRIYLSERNLRVLLSKLERYKAGDKTECTIVKYHNPRDPFCQTMDEIAVIAIPDNEYYVNREPGVMLDKDVV
jgi:hypothetical protein